MQVSKDDVRMMLRATFRYALGRRSYIPSYAIEAIKQYGPTAFVHGDWKQIAMEIAATQDTGDEVDTALWKDFQLYCLKKGD